MKRKQRPDMTPSVMDGRDALGTPRTPTEYVNFYGTYNIQPTAETENEYPAIAQGLSDDKRRERQKARDAWKEAKERQVRGCKESPGGVKK